MHIIQLYCTVHVQHSMTFNFTSTRLLYQSKSKALSKQTRVISSNTRGGNESTLISSEISHKQAEYINETTVYTVHYTPYSRYHLLGCATRLPLRHRRQTEGAQRTARTVSACTSNTVRRGCRRSPSLLPLIAPILKAVLTPEIQTNNKHL